MFVSITCCPFFYKIGISACEVLMDAWYELTVTDKNCGSLTVKCGSSLTEKCIR